MQNPAKTFTDLVVWRRSHQFVLEVYRLTQNFPKAELYGLTSQFRRAAVSVPANIAEGFKKKGKADKARLMNIAQGSLEEARYYLLLTQDLCYAETAHLLPLAEEVSKLLERYVNVIRDSEAQGRNSEARIQHSEEMRTIDSLSRSQNSESRIQNSEEMRTIDSS